MAGTAVAFRAIVPLLKIQPPTDRIVLFTVSGCLDAEKVGELCQLIDAEPASAVVVLDLSEWVLADLNAVRLLRDCDAGAHCASQLSCVHPHLDGGGESRESLSQGLPRMNLADRHLAVEVVRLNG